MFHLEILEIFQNGRQKWFNRSNPRIFKDFLKSAHNVVKKYHYMVVMSVAELNILNYIGTIKERIYFKVNKQSILRECLTFTMAEGSYG